MNFEGRLESIKSNLACPICKKLCKNVTMIEECCHIFCRKCITKKITEEKFRCCPVCKVDLGVTPLQKLKADYRLQSMRNRITAEKQDLIQKGLMKGKANASKEDDNTDGKAEERRADSLPLDEKEKSFSSSLNVQDEQNHTPRHGRRRSSRRRNVLYPTLSLSSREFFCDELEDEDEDEDESPESPVNMKKTSRMRKSGSSSKSSRQQSSRRTKERRQEGPLEHMNDLLKPLESQSSGFGAWDSSRLDSPSYALNSSAAASDGHEARERHNKGKGKETIAASDGFESRERDQKGKEKGVDISQTMHQDAYRGQEKRRPLIDDLNLPPQAEVDYSSAWTRERPIWFQLVPYNNENCRAPLPDLRMSSLRVKNPFMPASTIKSYLVQKLGLRSADEVEISLCGWPIPAERQLHELLDDWIRTRPPNEMTTVKVGDSAKEYLMPISYSRPRMP